MKDSLFILLMIAGLVAAPLAAAVEDPLDLSVELELGYGRDTNVSVDDIELTTSEGDNFVDMGLSGRVRYRPDERTDLGASFGIADKQYSRFDNFDGRLMVTSLDGDREFGDLTVGMNLRHIDYDLEGDSFLQMNQVSPTLSWFPSRRVYLRADYEWSDEAFSQAPDRDNAEQSLGVSSYFFLTGLQHYFLLRLEFAAADADRDVFSNETRELRLFYRKGFPLFDRDAALELVYRYQNRRYDEALEPSIREHREDRRDRFEVRLNYSVSNRLELSLRGIKADYRSNLDSADFNQLVVSMKLTYEMSW